MHARPADWRARRQSRPAGRDLDNQGGLISARGPLSIERLNVLDNRQGGEISSQQGFELLARRIDNGQQGRIISAGKLRLDATPLGNAARPASPDGRA